VLSNGQSADSTFNSKALSEKTIASIDRKINSINERVEKKTLKTLGQLQKQENKLRKKLAVKDSFAAKALFAESKYQEFTEKLKDPLETSKLKEYIPQFDILKTSLHFLDQAKSLTSKLPAGLSDKIKAANTSIAALESKRVTQRGAAEVWYAEGFEKTEQRGLLLRATNQRIQRLT
jgi:hypothetical protein